MPTIPPAVGHGAEQLVTLGAWMIVQCLAHRMGEGRRFPEMIAMPSRLVCSPQ